MATQLGWRWCLKCQGMFYAENPNKGICPADGQAHDGSSSGKYAMYYDENPFGVGQSEWKWCHKCQGLFYGPPGQSQGTCPTDEKPHDGSQSSNYSALTGDGTIKTGIFFAPQITIGQSDWHRCVKCEGLFYSMDKEGGVCALKAPPTTPLSTKAHVADPQAQYAMPWDYPKPTSRQFDSGYVTCDRPVGGYLQIVANSNGDCDFRSHAHDSGFDNIDYTISALIITPDNLAFPFQHSGTVEGTGAGLPFGTPKRDEDYDAGVLNYPEVSSHWDGILNGQLVPRIDGTDTMVKGITGLLKDMLTAYAEEVGKKAADYVMVGLKSS